MAPDGADPWMVLARRVLLPEPAPAAATWPSAGRPHIGDLRAGRASTVVWNGTPNRTRNRQIYAGEFHLLTPPTGSARWYFYYCADDGNDRNHRVYVLEADHPGGTPLGPYHFKAKLATDPDDRLYALDPDVFVLPDGRQYLLWAGDPDHRLFIQRLENPWTTTGRRQLLEADGFGCPNIREGPCTLVRNGRVCLIYSACDTGEPGYKLGMLTADAGADLVDPKSWHQHPKPVLERSDRHGVYGPGHNGFFKSPDGTQDWIVYAAKTESRFTYAGRTPRAQPFTWTADGLPAFPEPLALDADVPVPSGDQS